MSPHAFFFFSLAGKNNPVDEPGAFEAREWLRRLVVGKSVRFRTRKQGASAGDRVYGWLYFSPSDAGANAEPLELAVECVRLGHATPKAIKYASDKVEEESDEKELGEAELYEHSLMKAYNEAKEASRGIHQTENTPLVRVTKNAGDDFAVMSLVQYCQKHAKQQRITCVIEYIFDGSRFRCQVTDPEVKEYQFGTFTLTLAGAACPRTGNPRASPPTPSEPFSEEARQFSTLRLLQRELPISLVGTDKSGMVAVGTVHHPVGNISVELLKNGLARMTDWTVRMMPTGDVPALRVAENQAKRSLKGLWHSYAPPVLSSAAELRGTVVEVVSGDTLLLLPEGKDYTSESVLQKVTMASIRAPRLGRADGSRADEPYAYECKERVRMLAVGRVVSISIHYERDIPMSPEVTEKRAFGTVSVGKHADVAETLVSEGLAVTLRHRDDDEKSPRYDELRAAEASAKEAKKNVHNESDGKARKAVIDLTEPRKAKSYSGALMRAGNTKAVVDHVFNGALFKLLVPAENCFIRFAPNYIRCPQPSPSHGSRQPGKTAEPFGDESKRHARLSVLQHNVEISCSGVTNSGIITGTMYFRNKGERQDYAIELLGAGLANLDQRKIDYGEVPKHLLEIQERAKENKVGLWALAQTEPKVEVATKAIAKSTIAFSTIRLSEIRSGSHFFFQDVVSDSAKVVDDSMKLFTKQNGTAGAPCDVKVGKVVAALFDDGNGKSWYRAKVVERQGPAKVRVLFLDHGNVAWVPTSTHLRPLDVSLGVDRIPPVAREATLALTVTRPLETDEGFDAAQYLQSLCWGKDLRAQLLAPDDSGKTAVVLFPSTSESDESVNSLLISEGLARASPPKGSATAALVDRVTDGAVVERLASDLTVAQDAARRSRLGMWRYGDVGDDDDENA